VIDSNQSALKEHKDILTYKEQYLFSSFEEAFEVYMNAYMGNGCTPFKWTNRKDALMAVKNSGMDIFEKKNLYYMICTESK